MLQAVWDYYFDPQTNSDQSPAATSNTLSPLIVPPGTTFSVAGGDRDADNASALLHKNGCRCIGRAAAICRSTVLAAFRDVTGRVEGGLRGRARCLQER